MIVANIVVLMKSNIHNQYSLGIFALMFAAFFLAFAFESNFPMFKQIYLLFNQTFGQLVCWLIILFTILTSSAFELALHLNYKFKQYKDDANEK